MLKGFKVSLRDMLNKLYTYLFLKTRIKPTSCIYLYSFYHFFQKNMIHNKSFIHLFISMLIIIENPGYEIL